MKNLPEHEAFKALENRLSNYTEQPDDDLWQKIAAALPPRKPIWAPWLNRFAGILAVAALGWALWYRPAHQVAGDNLAIAQPKPASIGDLAHDDASALQIQQGNAASKDASAQTGQQELVADATCADEESPQPNQVSASSLPGASSGLNSNASDARSLNQRSASARSMSSDLNAQTRARSTTSRRSGTAFTSPTSDKHRSTNLPSVRSAQSAGVESPDAVVDASRGSAPEQESSLNYGSSSNLQDGNSIGAADLPTSLSTQNLGNNPFANDSSPQTEALITLAKPDSAGSPDQKTPYNRPKKKRADISFYAMFSPTLSFHTATPSARDGVIIQKFNKPSILSGDRLGLGLEAGVQGRLSKKFEYFAGLSVYHQSQTLQYTYQNPGNVVIDNGADDLSYTVKPNSLERSVSYNMLNIGAQAGVLYTLKEHRLSHKIGLGLQYQKGLTQASAGEPYDNASSSYLNYQVLYRAEIALDDRLTFIVQPSVTRTWRVNETFHVPFTLKQYRPGVSVGLSYRFRQ